MSRVLVVGSVAQDTIHNPMGTHPYILGGSAVFGSLSSSYFVPTSLVGVVGKDFPSKYTDLLRARNIDLQGLEVAEGKTFHWEGRYSDDLSSRESIKTELNCFAEFQPKVPAELRTSPYVMLGNIHPSLQLDVLGQLSDTKLVIADTMNFWITGTPKELAALLKRVDMLVVNEEEARQLSGEHAIKKVISGLLAMGPKILVIKRGEYGAILADATSIFAAPAYPLDLVADPTGAGDTFAGGLIGFVARENSVSSTVLKRAVVYGSVMASFCVEGIGVERLVDIKRDQVASRYRAFAELAHFASDSEIQKFGEEPAFSW